MNFVSKKDIYGNSKNKKPNTFIGGIAKTGGTGVNLPINTPASLASKLGISVNRISGFRIVNNDVECRITGAYELGIFLGGNNTKDPADANQNITFFHDLDNLVTASRTSFHKCNSLTSVIMNGCTFGYQVFRRCQNPNLKVEMRGLKTTNLFFSQLPTTFNMSKFDGWDSIETLETFAFHELDGFGFPEINMPSLKRMTGGSNLYRVRNCEKFLFQNVTSISGENAFTNGNRTMKLIDIRRCKSITGTRLVNNTGLLTPHASDFKIRIHQSMTGNQAIINLRADFPYTVVELYDDNGNYVSTL